MPRPKPIIKTPGAPVAQEDPAVAEADAAEAETDMDALEAAAPGLDEGPEPVAPQREQEPAVRVTPAQLAALVDQAVERRMGAKLPLPGVEAEIPDQSEVDPDKITRPTLTKQGYVVPRKYGEPADPAIKRV
jgi:hypothetical protein